MPGWLLWALGRGHRFDAATTAMAGAAVVQRAT